MPNLDVKDLVWKLAIKDSAGRILAGIDQFDEVHVYAKASDIFEFLTQAEDLDLIVMALRIGVEMGKEIEADEEEERRAQE